MSAVFSSLSIFYHNKDKKAKRSEVVLLILMKVRSVESEGSKVIIIIYISGMVGIVLLTIICTIF